MSTTARPYASFATHEVTNQAPPLYPHDVFSSNRPLAAAVAREGAAWVLDDAAELGRVTGGDPIRWGFEANENPPKLKTHDRWGHRLDEVEFHPAWHQLMDLSARWGLHGLPWEED